MDDDDLRTKLIPLQVQTNKAKTFTAQTNGSEDMSVNTWRQTRAVIIVCSCMFYFAFNRAIVSSIVNSQTSEQFTSTFNYTGNIVTTNAILSSIMPLGALVGSILCSFLIKQYSVRQILFSNCMFSLIFTIITMYTQIIILIIFRFFIGWTIGTYVAIIPSFIKQITSKNMAPYFGTVPVINQSLGGLFAFSLAYALYQATGSISDTWVIMCGINIIPLVIVMICIQLDIIYESPIYLLKIGHKKQALKTLSLIYKPEYVGTIVKQKELQIHKFYFNQLRLFFTVSSNSFGCRRDILIGIHLPILRRMSGVLVIILSSGTMLNTIDSKYSWTVPITISFIYFISCFLSNVMVKLLNRRATFQLGTVSMCILNACLAMLFYYQIQPRTILVFMIFTIIMYGLTFGPLVWPYLPEVVPAHIIPLAQASSWFIDALTLCLPGVLISHNDTLWPLFFVFSLWNLFSIIINHFLIVETKLKTMDQILLELKS